MAELHDDGNKFFSAVYVEDEHADHLHLKSADGFVRNGLKEIKCQIVATLYYQPHPVIKFRCVSVEATKDNWKIMKDATEIKFVDAYFDVLILSLFPEYDDAGMCCVTYAQKTTAVVTGADSSSVDQLWLHIYNFEQFSSNRSQFVTRGSESTRLDFASVNYKEFIIELTHVLKTSEQTKKMENSVGFGLTHRAKITHSTGKEFCPDDVKCHINSLGLVLSFMRGSFNFAPLISGHKSNEIVYESWSVPLARWHNHHNSFDVGIHPDINTNYIEELFPKFTQYIDSSDSTSLHDYEFLHRVVVTYTQANISTYIPNAIILVQVAFETIAYQYLVQRKKYISKEGYNSLKYESDKFRLLFGYLGISADVNAYSSGLAQKLARIGKNKHDLPRVLTEMRNSYIHADNSQNIDNPISGEDAVNYLQVMLHVLELTILALVGYQGFYRNRLKNAVQGTVERVPWAK